MLDAVVIGSGPNGLTAAVTLARAGRSVLVLEASETPGGGTRTEELTLPGFHHDVCSSVHPLLAISPAMRDHGVDKVVELVHGEIALAHPLDDGRAAELHRSLADTAHSLGVDGDAYRSLIGPLLRNAEPLFDSIFAPLLRVPRHPLVLSRFGLGAGIRSADSLATSKFGGDLGPALVAGMAAHSLQPLDTRGTAAVAITMALAGHVAGWPMIRGGSARITDALLQLLIEHGGKIECDRRVATLDDIPPSRVVIFDTSPQQMNAIAQDELPSRYRNRLSRFRTGPGVFKIDYALSGPIPWTAQACRRATTVHLGGTLKEISESEQAVNSGRHPERPFVLVAQAGLADSTRAPNGQQTGWAYCHVPNGSTVDMTQVIETQLERFAPGFKDLVLQRHTMNSADLQTYNANYIGGDIAGGAQTLRQTLFRPMVRRNPYSTPNPRVFICSASTPPGGGVHGMCGWNAAHAVLSSTLS